MGYVIEFNTVLKLPDGFLFSNLQKGNVIHVEKSGQHFLALHKPIEFCDSQYRYIGKIEIKKLTLEKDKTVIEAKVLEIFPKEIADIFTKAFIKQK